MGLICDKKRACCNVGENGAVLVLRGAPNKVNRDNKWSSVIRSPKMGQARWRGKEGSTQERCIALHAGSSRPGLRTSLAPQIEK